jgi:hypothetical protein
LLVLVALAVSLGDTRDATSVPDQVTLLETELESGSEMVVIDAPIARAVPRQIAALAEILARPPRPLDAGRVFRPPRMSVA